MFNIRDKGFMKVVENDESINVRLVELASELGKLDMVKEFIHLDYESHLYENAVFLAIENNHLDIVKYFVENIDLNLDELLEKAVIDDKPDIAEYLIEKGANLDYDTVYSAVENNAYDVLRIIINPEILDDYIRDTAFAVSSIEIIKLLIDVDPQNLYDYLELAVHYNMIDVVDYLVRVKKLHIDNKIIRNLQNRNRPEILRYLKRFA